MQLRMMKFRFIYGAILLLSFAVQANAQSTRFSLIDEQSTPLFSDSTKAQITLSQKYPTNPLQITPIPKAYCYEDLAIFCKLEVKLEKTLKFPVKIRLGEVNYVEMLEGKPYTPDPTMNYE